MIKDATHPSLNCLVPAQLLAHYESSGMLLLQLSTDSRIFFKGLQFKGLEESLFKSTWEGKLKPINEPLSVIQLWEN